MFFFVNLINWYNKDDYYTSDHILDMNLYDPICVLYDLLVRIWKYCFWFLLIVFFSIFNDCLYYSFHIDNIYLTFFLWFLFDTYIIQNYIHHVYSLVTIIQDYSFISKAIILVFDFYLILKNFFYINGHIHSILF